MRIAFYTPRASHLKPGASGDRVFLQHLLTGLKAREHEIQNASRTGTYDFWRQRVSAPALAAEVFAAHARMQQFAPDAWLVYGASTVYPDLFGWWQRGGRYVHLNAAVGDTERLPEEWRNFFSFAHHQSLVRADAVVAHRAKAADLLLAAGVPDSRLITLPPAVEEWPSVPSQAEARRMLDLPEKAAVILCVGRLTEARADGRPWKTEWILDLLELVAVADLPTDAILVLAGDGSGRPRVEETIGRLQINNRVVMTGAVDHAEISRFYAACDFFAYVATSDRIWHSGLEAQACGRPLLTLYNRSSALVVQHERTGLLARDRQEFVQLLAQLARDPARCQSMGLAAREYIRRNHSFEVRVAQIEQLLSEGSRGSISPSPRRRAKPSGDRRKVLVTGGLGFIGSFVSESLLARGDHVTVVDSGVSSVCDVEDLRAPVGSVDYVCMSVDEYVALHPSMAGFDLVVHCASYVGPASILNHVGRIGPAIIRSTATLIEACLNASIPLINFSSAEVYGKSGMLVENSDIRVPPRYNARIEYALGKLTAEAMCINSKARGLRTVVLRPFNVAGPRQSRFGGFVLPTFVQQALLGQPLTVFATGRQKRAFLSVRDLCRFINDYLPASVFDHPRVFNVGNPANATTIYDLAVRVRDRVGSASDIVLTDARTIYGESYEEAESFEKLPDIHGAQELGWEPQVSLDGLIDETIAYYRTHRDTRAESIPLPAVSDRDARGATATR